MFERFTEGARQVVVLAQQEARMLRHNYIGTEHLLLGLLREGGVAARTLGRLDVTVEQTRAQILHIVGRGDDDTTGQIPFTPRAKKTLELAVREGRVLKHNYVGTEHILLGLIREGQGVATRRLLDSGLDADRIAGAVFRELGREPAPDYAIEPMRGIQSAELRHLRRRARSGPTHQVRTLQSALPMVLCAGFGLGALAGWLIWA